MSGSFPQAPLPLACVTRHGSIDSAARTAIHDEQRQREEAPRADPNADTTELPIPGHHGGVLPPVLGRRENRPLIPSSEPPEAPEQAEPPPATRPGRAPDRR